MDYAAYYIGMFTVWFVVGMIVGYAGLWIYETIPAQFVRWWLFIKNAR